LILAMVFMRNRAPGENAPFVGGNDWRTGLD